MSGIHITDFFGMRNGLAKIAITVLVLIVIISALILLTYEYAMQANFVELQIDPSLSSLEVFPTALPPPLVGNYSYPLKAQVRNFSSAEYWMRGDLETDFAEGTQISYGKYYTSSGHLLSDPEGGSFVITVLKYNSESSARAALKTATYRRALSLVHVGNTSTLGRSPVSTDFEGWPTLYFYGGRFIIIVHAREDALLDIGEKLISMYN